MSETVANSREAYKYITNLIDDTVSKAKQLLDTLETEAVGRSSVKSQSTDRVILQGDVPPAQTCNKGNCYLTESFPLLGARITCDIYRSLDKKRVMITQTYETQEEISDEVARQLEKHAQSSAKRSVVGGDDLVRV